ncbi:Ribosomal protein S5 2-like protein [Venustampulla echinocandica]|uniref:Ribosomal protein S5 2-like protein n=1 Tax=Venustampulla echinocandica TaxID=2656787 RepID=A0A370T9N4_9HELO|nr:Ribosomal protein S5 2-like protein [Venustampulla echinocandica]RDL30363.1 Ribosomal protein S5 2-like protein [Venustampulla echinocandica]
MSDRRRINGPSGGTSAPIYSKYLAKDAKKSPERPTRTREPNVLRKMFLKTGVTPSASGSAYLELEASKNPNSTAPGLASLSTSGLKLTCTVHGPRPLPKSAPFSPHIILTTHVKYAPFATRKRRGYLRDSTERDLGVHLETALRGVIIGDRWPKSGVEVIITILEGEEDQWWGDDIGGAVTSAAEWGMMSVLSGCITVASAAIADAGIDCVDVVAGGVAAAVKGTGTGGDTSAPMVVLDPVPSEHKDIIAACIVGYLPGRDEITDLWVKGEIGKDNLTRNSVPGSSYEELADNAVQAALGAHRVLIAALKETTEVKMGRL